MRPLHRLPTPQSVHSWWSDSNPPGATIPLHTLAKPLIKYLHRRQVSGIIEKSRSSPLSKEVLDILKCYLEAGEIASSTKIIILRDLGRRAQRKDQARTLVQENVHYIVFDLLHSPETSTPELWKLKTGIVESACAILATFTLMLPLSAFAPDLLQIIFDFLYTVFSQRICMCDLSTGLALMLLADDLTLPTRRAEIQARVIAEMAHGLFHAELPFAEYEALTALTDGSWRARGCTCPQCAARIPRILEFALRPDVQDAVLERGARRALVALFGSGWCTPEFAALSPKLHAAALADLAKRTTPGNALSILWAAEAARAQLSSVGDAWAGIVSPLIEAGRSQVDAVLELQSAQYPRLAEIRLRRILPADRNEENGKHADTGPEGHPKVHWFERISRSSPRPP
ncbi:hypothetical protein DFH09DRAFT_1311479 [Mycena vulgaris]|nr:hypothetical protein DFH09DRAFT_1311479 [Mycena vulgaris]